MHPTELQKMHNELCDRFDENVRKKKGEYDSFDLAMDVYKDFCILKKKYRALKRDYNRLKLIAPSEPMYDD